MTFRLEQGTRAIVVIALGIACVVNALVVEGPAEKSAADLTENSREKNERDSAIERAKRQMRECEMRKADESSSPIERIDRALLLFGDAARNNTNGTLWAFGTAGRPAAFLELYQGVDANSQWCHAVTLTGTGRIDLKTPRGDHWRPRTTQIEPVAIPDAMPPGEKEDLRLRQMKEMSRRFAAHEYWDPDNSRFELRLLVQPVYRYKDTAVGIYDGAAFALANGTNPEVLLLIEALGQKLSTSRWHYSLARLGSAELHVELDGKEVWKQSRTPGVIGSADDPYWLFFSPSVSSD